MATSIQFPSGAAARPRRVASTDGSPVVIVRGDSAGLAADRLGWMATLYLTAPLLLFVSAWLQPFFAVPGLALSAYALLKWRISSTLPRVESWRMAFVAFCAIAAVIASAISPLVNGIPCLDLMKHRAILRELVTQTWPVAHPGSNEVLRYALGFYLLPAGLAKLAPQARDCLQIAWAAIGVALFLMLVARQARSLLLTLSIPLLVLLFAGLEQVGAGGWTGPLSVWSRDPWGWMIGSNAFNLNWTPQHAIAAWLATTIIYQHRDDPHLYANGGILIVATGFWSPFVGAATGLLLAFSGVGHWRSSLSPQNVASGLAGLPIAAYLLADPAGIPVGTMLKHVGNPVFWTKYFSLMAIAYGATAILIVGIGIRHRVVWIALIMLAAFPLIAISESNFQVRASVVPMTVLLLAAIDALQHAFRTMLRVALTGALVIGAAAGAAEGWRSWKASYECAVDESPITDAAYRGQYFSSEKQLRWLLRLE